MLCQTYIFIYGYIFVYKLPQKSEPNSIVGLIIEFGSDFYSEGHHAAVEFPAFAIKAI